MRRGKGRKCGTSATGVVILCLLALRILFAAAVPAVASPTHGAPAEASFLVPQSCIHADEISSDPSSHSERRQCDACCPCGACGHTCYSACNFDPHMRGIGVEN
jgi:hypothetical protein